MKQERRWSSYIDWEDVIGTFGRRLNYSRGQWVEQVLYWCDSGFEEDEYEECVKSLNEMSDVDLMRHIEETWNIGIRDTTWLKAKNQCYWMDPAGETSGVYTIKEIRLDENDDLWEDTVLLLSDGYSEVEALFKECYGLTDKKCPKCGEPLLVSDLCSYDYVCLECDENFNEIEVD